MGYKFYISIYMLKRYNQLSTQDESRLCDPVLRARRTKPHSLEKKNTVLSAMNVQFIEYTNRISFYVNRMTYTGWT